LLPVPLSALSSWLALGPACQVGLLNQEAAGLRSSAERPDADGLPWLKPRFVVEAASLILLSERTSIPVPKLIAAGVDNNGLAFVETEYIFGLVRGDMAALDCRMPKLHRFQQPGLPCTACGNIVRANADQFVREVVLP